MKNILVIFIYFFATSAGVAVLDKKAPSDIKAQAEGWLNSQSIAFIENKGQLLDSKGNAAPHVLFKAEGAGVNLYITEKVLTYIFNKKEDEEKENEQLDDGNETKWTRIDMRIASAIIKKENIIKEKPSETNYNFFNIKFPDGIYGVKKFEKITIKNIYPHIDWVLYGSNANGFKYDFIVFPGADPNQIELIYSSLNQAELDNEGNINIETELGNLSEKFPISYQNGKKISTRFIKTVNNNISLGGVDSHIHFELDNYDRSKILTIDPQLVWGTYFGGSNADGFLSIDNDAADNIFITGYAGSSTIPTANPGGGAYFFGGTNAMTGVSHLIILKFNNLGTLLWCTFYGAHTEASFNIGTSVSIDINGNILITGFTESPLFPTQNPGLGAFFQASLAGGGSDAFIMKFNNSGIRQWVTYYGGSGIDHGHFISSDALGNIFVTGYTTSSDFPTLNGGSGQYYQALNGGGMDAFILAFNNNGVSQWATYYGGGGDDVGNYISADALGSIFITGITKSINLPTLDPGAGIYFQGTNAGGVDAFISKFNISGTLQWATYYGGSNYDSGYSGVVSATGELYIGGFTASANFPTYNPAGNSYFQGAYAGGNQDAFILRFSNSGILQWATYYGGSGSELSCDFFTKTGQYKLMDIDKCGNLYFIFETSSTNIPTKNTGCGNYFNNPGTNTYNFFGTILGDVFVAQFNSVTLSLIYATNLFPQTTNSVSFRESICIDNNGAVIIIGERLSLFGGSLPPLMNPGGGALNNAYSGNDDAFLLKLVPTLPTFTSSQVNTSGCGSGNNNGSATIAVSCGIATFNYTWSNGSTTLNSTNSSNTISGLAAGNYTVTVNDGACILYH